MLRPSSIRELADAIVAAHKAIGRDLGRLLDPGLSAEEINAKTSSLPCHLPASVKELLQWHDGTRKGVATFGDMWLLPGFHLISLDDAIDIYKMFMESEWNHWNKNWFPVFRDPAIDVYAVVCGPEGKDDAPVMRYACDGTEDPGIEFSGLRPMFSVVLAALRSNAYFINNEGLFDVDESRLVQLIQEIDPNPR